VGVIDNIENVLYSTDLPRIKDNINRIIKIKNRTLAMPAAPAAIPPNPKIAAIIAITRKIIVQRNICTDLD
jgi:hypothetical protein